MSKPSTARWKYPLRLVRKIINKVGYELVQKKYLDPLPTNADPSLLRMLQEVRPYSMASNHRLAAMVDSVRYVAMEKVPGAIVECGVWRGANMMIAAKALIELGVKDRELYLYDTFEGMPPPTKEDRDYSGVTAEHHLSSETKGTGVWCEASLEDVQANMAATGYPPALIHYLKGMVEQTIPKMLPQKIALLRLDTDWYESTRHELEHLYPLLEQGGVLLIDDYGHWQGSRQAVDEYFQKLGLTPLLHRIDSSCRSFMKLH